MPGSADEAIRGRVVGALVYLEKLVELQFRTLEAVTTEVKILRANDPMSTVRV